MTKSRAAFEAAFKMATFIAEDRFSVDAQGGYTDGLVIDHWQTWCEAWQAGRETMRDEAMKACLRIYFDDYPDAEDFETGAEYVAIKEIP